MGTIISILLLFIIYSACGLLTNKRKISPEGQLASLPAWSIFVLVFCTIVMIWIATFRPTTMPDRQEYVNMLKYLAQESELGYNIIEFIIHKYFRSNEYLLFFIMACLCIPIKVAAIIKLSRYIWLALAIYVSSKYILQDMIQIRGGVATGIFLYCCRYKLAGKPIKYFMGTIIGVLFHWSSLLMVPAWFLSSNKINIRIYFLGIVIAYILAIKDLYLTSLLIYIPIPQIQILYAGYVATNDLQTSYNILSIVMLSRVVLCMFLLWFSHTLGNKDNKFYFFIKVYALSIMLYALLGDVTVAAIRLSEFYQIIEILLFPMICNLFRQQEVGKFIVLSIGVIYLVFNLFITQYIQW